MSLATLTVSAADLTNYWDFPIPIAWVICILIIGIASSNVFGVRVCSTRCLYRIALIWLINHQIYGNLEWTFKWMKILLIIGLDILMIAINRGGKSEAQFA